MPANRKISLYFFSGTGNTLWVSREFAAEMARHNYDTELIPLPASHPDPDAMPDGDIIAVAFPVYANTAPPFICDWLAGMPESHRKTPVIMISTLAGFSGLVKVPFRNLLEKKGYAPLAVREFIMPPNYFHKYCEERNESIRKRAKPAIAEFANDIAGGNAKWSSGPSILNILQVLMLNFFRHGGIVWMGRGFRPDSRCTKCGLCIRLCPVKCIVEGGNGYPKWTGRCEQCLRCITYCPAGAISNPRMWLVNYPGYKCAGISPKDLTTTSGRPESQPEV